MYACSSLLQENYINVTHNESGRQKEFKNLTEFKGRSPTKIGGWLKDLNHKTKKDCVIEDFTIEHLSKICLPDTVAFKAIDSAISAVSNKDWCDSLKLTIGGVGNYRERLAFSYPYKSGRPPKPLKYKILREYVIDKYGDDVIIEDGIEADDVTSIMGWWAYRNSADFVMVHIDKDINQVPGWHYNPSDNSIIPSWIAPSRADLFFYKQMLSGDRVDSILGIKETTLDIKKKFAIKTKGVGKTAANKIVEYDEDILKNILWCYKQCYTENPSTHFHENSVKNIDWHITANEQFQLLRMMDRKGVIPNLYDYCEERGVDISEI